MLSYIPWAPSVNANVTSAFNAGVWWQSLGWELRLACTSNLISFLICWWCSVNVYGLGIFENTCRFPFRKY